MKKYFFSQDESSHWYMIPVENRERWKEVKNMDEDKPETWEAFKEFEGYRTGGGISHIEFTIE